MKKKILTLLFAFLLLLSTGVSLSAASNNSPHNKSGMLVEEIRIDSETGEEVFIVGQIVEDTSGEIKAIKKGDLILTPYSKSDEVEDEAIKERLLESKKELIDDKPDLLEICPTLKDSLKQHKKLKENNIVVAEVYDVTLTDEEAKEMLLSQNNKLNFRMYVDFDEDEDFIFMFKGEDGTWQVIDDVIYVVDKNGNYLYFSLESEGCLALIRKGDTRDYCLNIFGICSGWTFITLSIIELLIILYLLNKLRKNKKDNEEVKEEVKEETKEEIEKEEIKEEVVAKKVTKKKVAKKPATKKKETKTVKKTTSHKKKTTKK